MKPKRCWAAVLLFLVNPQRVLINNAYLGSGGAVFRALHLPTGQRRAIKVAKPKSNDKDNAIYQSLLLEEANLMSSLNHPNIAKVYEVI